MNRFLANFIEDDIQEIVIHIADKLRDSGSLIGQLSERLENAIRQEIDRHLLSDDIERRVEDIVGHIQRSTAESILSSSSIIDVSSDSTIELDCPPLQQDDDCFIVDDTSDDNAVDEANESGNISNVNGLNCPICLKSLNLPTSTNCGHVFCEPCLLKSFDVNRKCPVCKKKLRLRDFHRIYL